MPTPQELALMGQGQAYQAAQEEAKQKALLQQQGQQDLYGKLQELQAQSANQKGLATHKQGLEQQTSDTNLSNLEKFLTKLPPGTGASLTGTGGASVTKGVTPPNPLGQERLLEGKQEGLSKRYQAINGFTSALNEIEGKTDRDGQGGVVTNPNAQLISTGKRLSAVPTGLVGFGEMLGAPGLPAGVTDERKSMERLQLEYQKAMTGVRTSDEMRKAERQALGMIASGDHALAAKGIRALAKNVANATRAIQAGYVPEVRDRVHSVMGDPMEHFSRVYDDGPAGAAPSNTPQNAPGSTIAPPAGGTPQAPSGPPPGLSFEQFKAWKSSQSKPKPKAGR